MWKINILIINYLTQSGHSFGKPAQFDQLFNLRLARIFHEIFGLCGEIAFISISPLHDNLLAHRLWQTTVSNNRFVDFMNTKEKILRSASAEFAKKGFDAATIRGICGRAGVNVAAVNYHFSSKSQLYEKVFEYLLEKTEQINTGDINTRIGTEEEWHAEVEAFIRRMLRQCTSENCFDRELQMIFAREEIKQTDNFSGIYRKLLAPRLEDIRTLFSYGDVGGEEELDICVLSIIGILLNFSERRVMIKQLTGKKNFGRENFDLIVRNIFSGIKETVKWKGRPDESF